MARLAAVVRDWLSRFTPRWGPLTGPRCLVLAARCWRLRGCLRVLRFLAQFTVAGAPVLHPASPGGAIRSTGPVGGHQLARDRPVTCYRNVFHAQVDTDPPVDCL